MDGGQCQRRNGRGWGDGRSKLITSTSEHIDISKFDLRLQVDQVIRSQPNLELLDHDITTTVLDNSNLRVLAWLFETQRSDTLA